MDKEKWLKIRLKMLRYGVTFESVAHRHKTSRQRVFQIVQKGYPAKGLSKRVLDDFYGRIGITLS